MAEQPAVNVPRPPAPDNDRKSWLRKFFTLRGDVPLWLQLLLGALCIALVFLVWWYVTRGEAEERIVNYYTLPSPTETFGKFYPELWSEVPEGRDLPAQTYFTLRRLFFGFGLAALVGIPIGILCGCFESVNAFFTPLIIFGRNIPMAALVGLMLLIFDIGETQMVMFIFVASVAFIISDTAQAIRDVGEAYVDTAYTLGSSPRQVILKVLIPLAMPNIFNSLRLMFGLAFGYIMLAEAIGASNGLGHLIIMSQKRGPREHIFLALMIIPALALGVDRLLYWAQKELFPHRYGGPGLLHQGVRLILYGWDRLKSRFWKPSPETALILAQSRKAGGPKS